MTEPSGGSDVASLKTKAVRRGDHFIVNGSKMFITSGMRADTYVVGEELVVKVLLEYQFLLLKRRHLASRKHLKKMGWLSLMLLYFTLIIVKCLLKI